MSFTSSTTRDFTSMVDIFFHRYLEEKNIHSMITFFFFLRLELDLGIGLCMFSSYSYRQKLMALKEKKRLGKASTHNGCLTGYYIAGRMAVCVKNGLNLDNIENLFLQMNMPSTEVTD